MVTARLTRTSDSIARQKVGRDSKYDDKGYIAFRWQYSLSNLAPDVTLVQTHLIDT